MNPVVGTKQKRAPIGRALSPLGNRLSEFRGLEAISTGSELSEFHKARLWGIATAPELGSVPLTCARDNWIVFPRLIVL